MTDIAQRKEGQMKELELTVSLRNNRLKERRLALGMTQAQLGKAVGMCASKYGAFETLYTSPQVKKRGEWRWRESSLKIARFHCVEPEELFPQVVLEVQQSTVSRKVNGDSLFPLIGDHKASLLEGPEALLDKSELAKKISLVLGSLKPREVDVMLRRYGLNGFAPHSLGECGDVFGLSKERIRQIEAKALRKLRHPTRAKKLRGYLYP